MARSTARLSARSPLWHARTRLGLTQAAAMRAFAREVRKLGEQVPGPQSLRRMFAYWESGQRPVSLAAYQRAFTIVYQMSAIELGFAADISITADVETVRRSLDELLQEGGASTVRIHDWERIVDLYGAASRDRTAGDMVRDLIADLDQVARAMQRTSAASILRRLTILSARLSGLIVLAMVKQDRRAEFRSWAATARLAAHEAADAATTSWVLAQEAYGHFYCGRDTEAAALARGAQEVAADRRCAGVPLAAALEARACARLGRSAEAVDAITRAEMLVGRLDTHALAPSAFGYNEAQLRFHEGNTYAHLGDCRAAFPAQQRALELCAAGDYTDRAMVRLDKAITLVAAHETDQAAIEAVETLADLTSEQRRGIIDLRAREVLAAMPRRERSLPVTVELRDIIEAGSR